MSAGIAWSAFDVYYGDGDNLMATGMWKYRDKQWEPRPWYEVWKAVTENMRYGKDVLAVAGATADVHAAVVGHAIAEDESGRKARSGYSVLLSNRSDTDTLLSVPLDGHGWRGWRADVGVITAVGKPSQMVINENYEENEKYVRVTLPARSFCTIEIKFATQPAKVARRVATRDKIKAINTIIAKLDDGTLVRFLDSGERFLQGDGTLSKDIMPDYVHLSAKGYQIWAESMQPLLAEMLSLPATQPERP